MEQFETALTPPLEIEGLTPPKRRSLFGGLNSLLRVLSPSERLTLYALSLLLGISAFVLLADLNKAVSTEVPTQGGSLVEGSAGIPRFINPLLDVSEPDQDLTTLIYSGLLRAGTNGTYLPDLAEGYDISRDGTVYTFHLRPNLSFHNGTPLTSADVLFTVSLAQNPDIKSPRRADWEGVSVSAPDTQTIIFTLPHAYAPFLENTTLGILPKNLWENVPAEEFPFSSLNTNPVGSGPYRLKDITLDTTGAPTEYRLAAFSKFALGAPNLTAVIYRAYPNDEALMNAFENGDIQSFVMGSPKDLPQNLGSNAQVQRATLARVFGIFLNQSHAPILTNASVRAALNEAVDTNDIVQKVLGGYGVSLDGPVPREREGSASTTPLVATTQAERTLNAKAILSRGGWKFMAASSSAPVEQGGSTGQTPAGVWKKDKLTLSLTLATADTEELVATARAVADSWNALGIPTTVQVYPLSEFNSTILRPRAYDAVLFGEVVGRSLDLFAFWHSSQRNDPGLNLALYTSAAADTSLAALRTESDLGKREESLRSFLKTINDDMPAVFLYAPEIAYVIPSRIKGVSLATLTTPSDRFIDAYRWYRDTERVWNIFSK